MVKKPMPRIMPPTYFWIFLIITTAIHFVFSIKIIYFPYTLLGILLILFGTIITIWTDLIFKKVKTAVKPHEKPKKLIMQGPFKISRHPMYLGMACFLLGLAIFLGDLISFIFPIIFVVIMETKFIPLEEKNMQKVFGKKYLEYRKKIRKWI